MSGARPDEFQRGTLLPVAEESHVGTARRRAQLLADALGLPETARGKVGVIATELANNLVLHATSGVLLIQPVRGARAGVELVAVDRGPGMPDPARCLQDGYSTGGTGGTGLGAIKRLSDEFDLDSKVGVGTIIVARVWRDDEAGITARLGICLGGVCAPIDGEQHIGDGWMAAEQPGWLSIMIADGLGHGIDAELASRAAVDSFIAAPAELPGRIVERSHEALRSTRGAAVSVARIEREEVRFAGVGNVTGSVIEGTTMRHMVSHNGIVGHQMARVQEFTYAWSDRSLLVMTSDGIKSQWRLDAYPGIMRRHPTLVAATLWRDFSRGRDDATVVVAQGPALRG